MITEAMVIKGLAYVGAYTVAKHTIVPAADWAGNKIGHECGKLACKWRLRKNRHNKEKVGDDQATEQAIMALLAECDKALSENETKEEPVNTLVVVEEVKPEPMFDQKTQDWIRRCKEQYGGFAKVVLD